ncbi:MFS transporter [candidate division KSB3 bacterium]|uniref:MFS transporter n=1 Tax=candidate division KSB3 bacterium TaxID=2044937 RepID=A0A9D5Q5I5_9BACT|nr:MFS transporter [candidate division KSB3 bacterium]MBD3324660.1 MFS transporter [candidate division KSB3 bacterium]
MTRDVAYDVCCIFHITGQVRRRVVKQKNTCPLRRRKFLVGEPSTAYEVRERRRHVPGIVWIIAIAGISRFSLTTAKRFMYPFAPALSRGLGVPLSAITSVIAINQATSLLSIFFAPIGDQIGYRVMLLAGMLVLSVGMFAGGLMPVYGMLMLAFFLGGVGKSLFDPSLQAYVGARVAFERRGLAIGMIEVSWAASALLGIPLIGVFMERFGWRAPFFVIGSLAVLEMIALRLVIPDEGKKSQGTRHAVRHFGTAWRRVVQERMALSGLCYAFLFHGANDLVFVVYGAWLEQAFGLSLAAIGFSTTVIGFAELSGEGLTAFFSDRFGLQRTIVLGMIVASGSYLLLPLAGQRLTFALAGLFLVFVSFECTVVTALSFFTEVLPEARATMMSGYIASAGAGRICGALLGGKLWTMYQRIGVNSLTAALLGGLSLVFLFWGLRDWRTKEQ